MNANQAHYARNPKPDTLNALQMLMYAKLSTASIFCTRTVEGGHKISAAAIATTKPKYVALG
jgi:hypothetical protein